MPLRSAPGNRKRDSATRKMPAQEYCAATAMPSFPKHASPPPPRTAPLESFIDILERAVMAWLASFDKLLSPGQRHRQRGAGPGFRTQSRRCGQMPIIARRHAAAILPGGSVGASGNWAFAYSNLPSPTGSKLLAIERLLSRTEGCPTEAGKAPGKRKNPTAAAQRRPGSPFPALSSSFFPEFSDADHDNRASSDYVRKVLLFQNFSTKPKIRHIVC